MLLHGMPSDHTSWSPVVLDLADAGLPGHHARPARARRQRPHQHVLAGRNARCVHHLSGALGLDRFVLGGHSMGGTVATLFAERYLAQLAGLIMVDSPPLDGSGSWDPGPRPRR